MNEILDQVANEREYQKTKWGGLDLYNDEYNYAAYIGAYANRSLVGEPEIADRRAAFKADMIKVAALAVAAIENL